ncbi:ABC-three component system middle component 6 [Vibrio mediterranei]|uniref:ABC-three component system middle component 6 n=1 Tax=Vibrio mediterranei TaxID=689 RepID=UPI003CE4D1BB
MIISNHQSQKLSLIVIGANIITILKSNRNICPLAVFNIYRDDFDEITFTYFSYGLDWLFICGAIDIDEFGNIKTCS